LPGDKNKAPHLLGRCGARKEIKLCNIEKRKHAFIYTYVLTIVTELTIRLNTQSRRSRNPEEWLPSLPWGCL